jgi:hypothetical protein
MKGNMQVFGSFAPSSISVVMAVTLVGSSLSGALFSAAGGKAAPAFQAAPVVAGSKPCFSGAELDAPARKNIVRLKATLAGHAKRVTLIAISPDGQTIATGSEDHTVKLWEATTGELKKTLKGLAGSEHALRSALESER